MCSIHFIRTKDTSWCNHSNRQLSLFHHSYLYRGSLSSKHDFIVNIEGILFILCRVICRNIKGLKIVIVIFYLRTFYHLITHADKNSFQFVQCNRIWMAMSYMVLFCRKCNINHLCLKLCFPCSRRKSGTHFLYFFLYCSTGIIYHLSNLWTFLCRNPLHALEHFCQCSFFA